MGFIAIFGGSPCDWWVFVRTLCFFLGSSWWFRALAGWGEFGGYLWVSVGFVGFPGEFWLVSSYCSCLSRGVRGILSFRLVLRSCCSWVLIGFFVVIVVSRAFSLHLHWVLRGFCVHSVCFMGFRGSLGFSCVFPYVLWSVLRGTFFS